MKPAEPAEPARPAEWLALAAWVGVPAGEAAVARGAQPRPAAREGLAAWVAEPREPEGSAEQSPAAGCLLRRVAPPP
jgi:hypothetical protein